MTSDPQRTTIVPDNKLVEAGLKATGLKTRRELIDFALRELLRHKQQKKILTLKGKVAWGDDLVETRTEYRRWFSLRPSFGSTTSRIAI